jgi:hypothetical protein
MGMLDRLWGELKEGDRVFKRLGGVVHSDEKLRALTKVQKTLNRCIEIVRVAIRGERSPYWGESKDDSTVSEEPSRSEFSS